MKFLLLINVKIPVFVFNAEKKNNKKTEHEIYHADKY